MIVGGDPAAGKAEIYNLNGSSLNCPAIRDFPTDWGQFGTFINNKSLVCGGYLESQESYSSDCYSYHMEVHFNVIMFGYQ